MKKSAFLFCLLLGFFTFTACDDGAEGDTVEESKDINEEKETDTKDRDMEFVVKAASGGLFEVQAAQLALTKGTSQTVKDFAQKMMNDHGPVNDELKTLAQSKNITIPAAPGEDHQEKLDKLNKLTGAEFDKEYMDMMVKDHKHDIDMFEDAAEDGKDADIKAFAAKHLPTLKTHLQHAEGGEDHTDHMDDTKKDNDAKTEDKKAY